MTALSADRKLHLYVVLEGTVAAEVADKTLDIGSLAVVREAREVVVGVSPARDPSNLKACGVAEHIGVASTLSARLKVFDLHFSSGVDELNVVLVNMLAHHRLVLVDKSHKPRAASWGNLDNLYFLAESWDEAELGEVASNSLVRSRVDIDEAIVSIDSLLDESVHKSVHVTMKTVVRMSHDGSDLSASKRTAIDSCVGGEELSAGDDLATVGVYERVFRLVDLAEVQVDEIHVVSEAQVVELADSERVVVGGLTNSDGFHSLKFN